MVTFYQFVRNILKLGLNQEQIDASNFLESLLTHLHEEQQEPFMYEAALYVIGDMNKQIAHAAKEHWATQMSGSQYSKIKDIFYYQIVWGYQCQKCKEILHMFEIGSIFKVRMLPKIREKRCKIIELIELTLGMTQPYGI